MKHWASWKIFVNIKKKKKKNFSNTIIYVQIYTYVYTYLYIVLYKYFSVVEIGYVNYLDNSD